jgi:oligopeptide transport system permease protein
LGRYVLKRFFSMFVTLFLVTTFTFFLMHSIPGGPFTSNRALSPLVEEALKERYHLDEPLFKQYLRYLGGIARLDLGPSIRYEGMSVNELIKEGFPYSARIGALALGLILLLGLPFGVIAALRQNKWPDRLIMAFATLGITIPSFIIATIFLYVFSLKLNWFPPYGVSDWRGYVLPVLSLAGFHVAFISRLTRSSMLEVLQSDYIVAARAKGLSPFKVVYKHALKNALIPVVTVFGPLVAGLLTGTFVVEKIFAVPGMGKHFVTSISNRDYTTIMGITIFYALFLSVAVLAVDLVYGLIDPRIKLDKHGQRE